MTALGPARPSIPNGAGRGARPRGRGQPAHGRRPRPGLRSARVSAPGSPTPAFDDNALAVLEARYLRPRPGGGRETPDEALWRVARGVAAAEARWGGDPEAWARRFHDAMARRELLPNSPTLMNAGRPHGQLSACFVLPVADDLEAIFDAVKHAARIHQTGGGTGFSFSRLRPQRAPLATGGAASGPVAFMRVFDAASAAVHQGGVRRGANMGILRVDHPDVLELVDAKRRPGELTHFNISVGVTDAFMDALARGADYDLLDPRSVDPARPGTGVALGQLSAPAVWRAIAESAWATGDPGLVFLDRINALHPTPTQGAIESTNPCGELPLLPYESCNLGSVDVGKFLRPEVPEGAPPGDRIDWARLGEAARLGVRLLDDVIEANTFPLPEIDRVTRANRKVGLGVMGWADLLVALGLPYDAEPARALADRLMAFLLAEARAASAALAVERGPFPAWPGSRLEAQGLPPLRNATVTTIAPTGTIALLAGCSSGIEPLYALAYRRLALDGARRLEVVHPAVERLCRARGCWSEAVRAHVLATGRLAGAPGVPDDLARRLRTAHEVAPADHVRMQAAFQRHVENAVSKTINLPREARPDDVAAAYRLAWDLGCKGITVYRDGSRDGQVLATAGAQAYSSCEGPACAPPERPAPGLAPAPPGP